MTDFEHDDIINLSDLTDYIDEHETDENPEGDLDIADAQARCKVIRTVLDELRGSGGDHQWKGDWYPGYLVSDMHFQDYAQQLAEDIGAIPDNLSWPCSCIDWAQAARELRHDYSSIEVEGVTYWYR